MIAFNNGGISEVIRHTFNGLLVQPRAIDQLAHAMERLATNPTLRTRFGKVAKENCERFFSAELMVNKYNELYQQVLSEVD